VTDESTVISPDRYSYTSCNPVNGTDRTGLWDSCVTQGLIWVVGGAVGTFGSLAIYGVLSGEFLFVPILAASLFVGVIAFTTAYVSTSVSLGGCW